MSRHPAPRRPPRILPIARPGGGHRLLVELGPRDARAYRRTVGALTPRIERSLGPGVYANRSVGRGALAVSRLEPWLPAWERWVRRLRGLAGGRLVRADVASFYGSVGERALRRALGSGADGVLGLLRSVWDGGVTGLPIGPEPSAILANAVLALVDEALHDAGVVPSRWVDDWLIRVPSTVAAGRTLVVLERALRELGLELNPAKTSVLTPEGSRQLLGADGCGAAASGRAMMPAP